MGSFSQPTTKGWLEMEITVSFWIIIRTVTGAGLSILSTGLLYAPLLVAFMRVFADAYCTSLWFHRNQFERAPYKSRRQRRSCDSRPDGDTYLRWFPSLLCPLVILSGQLGSDSVVVVVLLHWLQSMKSLWNDNLALAFRYNFKSGCGNPAEAILL